MNTAAWVIAGVVAVLPQTAHAQAANPPAAAQSQGPPAAQVCVTCHGPQGEGNPVAGFPRIAGQSQYYISRQLESYANGSRRNAVMGPIAKGLSAQVRAAVAAYYSQIDAPAAKSASSSDSQRGRVLAMTGDTERRVQACINCHGPGGVGEPPAMPYLAGLDANYISAALNAWKDGTRRNDAGQQMAAVAKALTPEDVAAVAQHYASLPPPRPAPLNLVQAPVPRQKTTPATRPSTSQAADRPSVGIEQAAPMSGGTHGEGGAGASKGAPMTAGPQGQGGSGPSQTQTPNDAPKKRTPPTSDAPKTEQRTLDTGAVTKGDPARGRAIIASGAHGCAACHSIPGVRWPSGIVGPPLAGMAQRGFIAGQLPNKPDVLVAFLQNPPALVPETGMPNVGLTAEEARHVAAFLHTLEPSAAR
jgi:cytochrome c553